MSVNFNGTTPAALTGYINATFQTDGSGNISACLPGAASVITSAALPILQPALTSNFNGGSAKTIYTPTASVVLRVSWSQAIVVAAATSSTFPSLTLSWTDVGGIARTQQLVATSATNTTAVYSNGSAYVYTNTSGPVSVTSASYASNTAAQMTYALEIFAEIL